MATHIKYPSIEQFKSTIHNVKSHAQFAGKDENGDAIYDYLRPLPVLDYQGVTKLHGTNFAMGRIKSTGEIWFQSREQIITPEKDNAGAARFFHDKDLNSLFDKIPGETVIVYGEWCGKGIQSKVSISQVPKRLVIFDILADDRWLRAKEVAAVKDESIEVYNIYDYAVFNTRIDFNDPGVAQNELIKITTGVADCCPVAQAFGVEGIGEGVVWRCVTPGYESPKFFLKVKDERHSPSKVTTLKEVDTEKNAKMRALAEKLTPSWRLEQALVEVCGLNNPGGFISLAKIGEYFKAVNQDINKEEKETMVEAGVEDFKDVVKYVTQISKAYFIGRESGSIS